MIHLVMGISSAGKSYYIKNHLNRDGKQAVMMASNLLEASSEEMYDETIVHYNLFRPYDNKIENIGRQISDDHVLQMLLNNKRDALTVTIIISKADLVAKRCLLRKYIEPEFGDRKVKYPFKDIFKLLSCIDCESFHNKWFDLLENQGIEYTVVHSKENGVFEPVRNRVEAILILNEKGQ